MKISFNFTKSVKTEISSSKYTLLRKNQKKFLKMECYEIGQISLTSNCWNAEKQNFVRFPCREVVCQEVPGSNTSKSLPDWAVALIICLIVLVVGFLALFYLKKKCGYTLNLITGFVMAASLVPPMPRTTDIEASRAKNLH